MGIKRLVLALCLTSSVALAQNTPPALIDYGSAPSSGGGGGGSVNEVVNVDGTLTISPTTGNVVASLNLSNANTWLAEQVFINSDLILLGSSTGQTTFTSANAGATNFTLTFPAANDTLADLAGTQALTNKTYNGNTWTSGTGTLTLGAGKTATISNTLTFTGTDGSSVAFGSGGTVLYGNQTITLSGDITGSGATSIATTLATVNTNTGSFGSATSCPAFTVNGKGLITAASAATCAPAIGSITGLGTGVATALGNAISGTGRNIIGTATASPAQGDVIYYNGTNWVDLAPGTSGNFLQTQGASANPQWASASGSGTVNAGTTPDGAYYATSTTAISDAGAAVVTFGGINYAGTTVPTLGVYTSAANTLSFSTATARRFSMTSALFAAANSSGGGMENASTSSTVPTLLPDNSVTTAGVGGAASVPAMIVGSASIEDWASTGPAILVLPSDAATTDNTLCLNTSNSAVEKGSGTLGICLGTSSTADAKTDVIQVREGLAATLALKPVNYFYRKGFGDNGLKEQYGFLAEDYDRVLPKLTRLDKNGKPNGVDILGLVPVLVRAIQEMQSEIDHLGSAALERLREEVRLLFAWNILLTAGFGYLLIRRK